MLPGQHLQDFSRETASKGHDLLRGSRRSKRKSYQMLSAWREHFKLNNHGGESRIHQVLPAPSIVPAQLVQVPCRRVQVWRGTELLLVFIQFKDAVKHDSAANMSHKPEPSGK